MKKILFFLILSGLAWAVRSQVPFDTVNVFDPQNFVEQTVVDTANFQFIGRKNNLNRRMNPYTMKKYSTPDVFATWVNTVFDSVGNSSTYYDHFVTDSTGKTWYIDDIGRGKLLDDRQRGVIDSVYIATDTLWIDENGALWSIPVDSLGGGGGGSQTLSISNDSLTISGGNTVQLGNAATGRIFQDTILLNNIFGVYYSDYTQADTVNFIVAPSGHKVGSTGYMRFTSDGVNPINFSADFNYIYGFTSGNILEAGTYEIYFQKTPTGISVSMPNSVAAQNTIDPLSYSPFLALVADSVSTITKSGGKVSAWASITGGDYTVRQATSGNRPLYVDDTFDYVQFSRDSSQYMSQDTIATNGLFNGVSKAFTSVIVFSTQDTTNNAFQSIWSAGNSGTTNYYKTLGYTDKDSLQFDVRVDASSSYPDDNFKWASQNLDWHIVAASFNGSTLSVYYDGVLVADDVAFNQNIDNGTFNRFAIGALSRTSIASYADVRIRRIYMYDDAFNQAVLYRFSQWLNNIYSIY